MPVFLAHRIMTETWEAVESFKLGTSAFGWESCLQNDPQNLILFNLFPCTTLFWYYPIHIRYRGIFSLSSLGQDHSEECSVNKQAWFMENWINRISMNFKIKKTNKRAIQETMGPTLYWLITELKLDCQRDKSHCSGSLVPQLWIREFEEIYLHSNTTP